MDHCWSDVETKFDPLLEGSSQKAGTRVKLTYLPEIYERCGLRPLGGDINKACQIHQSKDEQNE